MNTYSYVTSIGKIVHMPSMFLCIDVAYEYPICSTSAGLGIVCLLSFIVVIHWASQSLCGIVVVLLILCGFSWWIISMHAGMLSSGCIASLCWYNTHLLALYCDVYWAASEHLILRNLISCHCVRLYCYCIACSAIRIHTCTFVYIVEWEAIQRPFRLKKFKVHTEMNHNVGILRIFPGITPITVSKPHPPQHELHDVLLFLCACS